MLFILDKKEKLVGVLNNGTPFSCPYFDDLHTENIETGVNIYDFKVPANHETAEKLEQKGHVLFKDLDGKFQLFRIVNITEVADETGNVKEVNTEHVAIPELLGKVVRPTTLKSYTLEAALNYILDGTGYVVGEIEYTESKDVVIDNHMTVLEALYMLLELFNAEIQFEVDFSNGEIKRRIIHVINKRGNVTHKRFEYGKDLVGVTRTENSEGLVTALIGVGKGDTDGERLTLAGFTANVPEGYEMTPEGDYIGSIEALETYSTDGTHIFGIFEADTTSKADLYLQTLEELKVRCKPKTTYEMLVALLERYTGYEAEKVRVGDTINVDDTTFKPRLALEARVIELKRSYTNPENDEVTLGDYRPIKLGEYGNLTKLQNLIAAKEAQWSTIGEPVIIKDKVAPVNPVDGQLWIDTNNDTMHKYNASTGTWDKVTRSDMEEITGQVSNNQIADSAVTSTKIIDAAISSDKLAANSVTTPKISDSAITSVKIANLAVDSAKIKDAAINSAKIANLAVTTAKIDDAAITDAKIDRVSANRLIVKNADIQDAAIDSAKIKDASIVNAKIAEAAIGEANIIDGSIANAKIKDATISTAKIANLAVSSAKIADAAITSAKIEDAAITNAKIDRVTANKLVVGTGDLADLSVNTAKIADLSVGSAKIIDGSITNAKIENLAVSTAKIQDAAITNAKIDRVSANKLVVESADIKDAAITAAKIKDGDITNAKIANAAIETAKIKDAAITSVKIASAAIDNTKIDRASVNKLVVESGDIRDAAITSAKIANLAVDNGKIANLAVTNAKIADATISGAKIANATIDTANIKAGAITTALIKDAAIGSTQIADASITDAKIVNLSANKMTTGTLDASKVNVANLVADNIVTGTITITSANLLQNSTFKTTDKWSMSSNVSLDTTVKFEGLNTFKADVTGLTSDGWRGLTQEILCTEGEEFTASIYTFTDDRSTIDRSVALEVIFYDASNNRTLTKGLTITPTVNNKWERHILSGNVKAPPNTVKLHFRPWVQRNGRVWWAKPMLQKGKLATEWQPHTNELLAAKGITNLEIGDNAVDNRVIQADTITGNKLVADSITGREVKANSITSQHMVANTITAASGIIADGAITNAKIADATITSAKINSIDAAKINAGYISADRIAANSISASKLNIGDTTNYSSEQSYVDPQGILPLSGGYFLVNNRDNHVTNSMITQPLSNGDEFVFTVKAKPQDANTTSGLNAYIFTYYTDGTTRLNSASLVSASVTDWTVASATVKISSLDGTKTVRGFRPVLQIEKTSGATSSNNWLVASIDVRKKASGQLIVDGTIETKHLKADAITADKIAAKSITANEIADSTITGSKIANSTITDAKIANGSILGTSIANSTITGTNISGGTITDANIKDGTITGTSIANSTLTGAKLVDATITDAKINSVDAGKITTGFLDAKRIATNSITAQHIIIGDYTNLSQINEEKNPNGNYVMTVGDKKYFRVGPSGYSNLIIMENPYVEFRLNDEYFVSYYGWRDSTLSAVNFIIRYYYTDGTFTNAGSVNVTPGTAYGEISHSIKITTEPTAGKTVSNVRFFFEKTNTTDGYYYIRAIELRKKYNGELLVDGSIKTNHLTANSITATQIAANTITATEIKDSAITDAKILNGTITAASIKDATITGSKLVDATITTAKIQDAAITNAKISSLDAGKINAGTISADRIGARSITVDKMTVGDSPNLVKKGFDSFEQLPVNSSPFSGGNVAAHYTTNTYALDGDKSLLFRGTSTDNYLYLGSSSTDYHIPVNAGSSYIYSFFAYNPSSTAASVGGYVRTNDANNTHHQIVNRSITSSNGWTRFEAKFTVPSGANKAVMRIDIDTANVNVYFDCFMLEMADANTTEAGLWKPASVVEIHGGNIRANSITADAIAANTITATEIKSLNGLNVGNGQFVINSSGNVSMGSNTVLNGGVIRGAKFTGSTGDSMFIGEYGSSIDSAMAGTIKRFRFNVDADTYLAIDENDVFNFVMGGSFNTKIYKAGSHTNLKLGSGIIKGLGDADDIQIRTWDDTGYGNLAVGTLTVTKDINVWGNQTLGGRTTLTGGGGLMHIVGNGNAYVEMFPDGTSAGRKSFFGHENATGNNFVISSDSDEIILKTNANRVKVDNGVSGVYFRNATDSAYVPIYASAFTVNSLRNTKKDITPFETTLMNRTALDEILDTTVYKYRLNEESEVDLPRVGLIYEESPVEVVDLRGKGLDTYAMAALSWQAIKDLNSKLESRIAELENEITLLKGE